MTVSLPLNIRQNLRNLGLSECDIQILSFLFYVPKASLKDISQHTTISYSTCQYVTTNLGRLGLLTSKFQGKIEVFSLCTEKEFYDWIEVQKQKSMNTYDETREDMKCFFKMVQDSSWKPNLTYYEGVEGVKSIYEDMLKTGKDIYGWTDISLLEKTLGKFLQDYIRERVKRGMKSFSIRPLSKTNKEYAKKEQKRESRFVDELPLQGEIRIFGDKVAVITFDKKNPVGFVIEGKMIADMYRGIFHSSWQTARVITSKKHE